MWVHSTVRPASKHGYRSQMTCQNCVIGTKSHLRAEKGGRRASRRTRAPSVAHGSFLSHFSPRSPPRPPSFVCGFAMTYPKQTTRKRGKRSGAATEPRGRRGAGRTRGKEKEREMSRGRRGTEREDGREPHSRPHTPERLQHTDGKEEQRELSLRERRKSARAERGGVRGTEFILRAFFYRSLTPCSSAAPRRECSALLHDKIAFAGAAGRKR